MRCRKELSANAAVLSLCTFFFEKKVRKKAIQEAHPPERPPEKVQGGAFLPRQLYQSKGGSAVRILRCFGLCGAFVSTGTGRHLPPSLREVAFSKENDGRSLQGGTSRYYQKGSFPQTPFHYLFGLQIVKDRAAGRKTRPLRCNISVFRQ